MKELIYILSEKNEYEIELSKNLKRIYDFNYKIIEEGTLADGIKDFKSTISDLSESLNQRTTRVQNNLINKLKCFLINQVSESKSKINKANTTESDFKMVLNEMIDSKKNFHQLAQGVEESKISAEIAKINPNNKGDMLQKILNKLYHNTQQAKEAESVYIKNLEHCNSYHDFYIDKTQEILDGFQEMELEYNKFMKQILSDYYNETIAFAKETLEKAEINLSKLNKIKPEEDVLQMIQKQQTNLLPPSKVEFIPYSLNTDKIKISKSIDQTYKNSVNITELYNTLRTFMKSTFTSEVPETTNPQEIKVFGELKQILSSAWDGRKIENEEKKIYNKCMKEKIYRKYFLTCMNKYRIAGMFILDSEAYDIVVDLLITLLDHSNHDKDYESMKFCMILSQTFYKPCSDSYNFLTNEKANEIDKDSFAKVGTSGSFDNKSILMNTFISTENAQSNINNNQNKNEPKEELTQTTEEVTTRIVKKQQGRLDNNLNAPRIFVQIGIQDHEALTNIDNWSGMIKYSIREELSSKSGVYVNDNLANMNISCDGTENKEVKSEMLKNISFGQLISFSYNMTTFGFSKEQIRGLIKVFCSLHEIPAEMQEMINLKVEECNEELKENIRNSISDSNIARLTHDRFKSFVDRKSIKDDQITKILPGSILSELSENKTRNTVHDMKLTEKLCVSDDKKDIISNIDNNEDDKDDCREENEHRKSKDSQQNQVEKEVLEVEVQVDDNNSKSDQNNITNTKQQ